MIQPSDFLQQLAAENISFFAGVPDSLLKGLITAIEKNHKGQHYITANEGAALALAAGYHFATGELPLVYLQNSGLGNLINPLTSLADRDVYGIPVLLVVGWRGEPGLPDEPQHTVMGALTTTLLHQLRVPFIVLKKEDGHEWIRSLQEAANVCRTESRPVALVIESGVFPEEELHSADDYALSSAEAMNIVYNKLQEDDVVICTTGKIGRSFYRLNVEQKKIKRYFLNVGSMGHAVSVATGLALHSKSRVVLFDGDGALLMHMGALALAASLHLKNFVYVLLNNGSHQSVGSQPTLGFHVNFCTIAKGCGFQNPVLATTKEDLLQVAKDLKQVHFLEIRINNQVAEDLPRPKESPREAKEAFMQAMRAETNRS